MTYILALDQGTTSSRALLIDADGRVAASAQREFTQHFPAPGLVEHDPEEIWATQLWAAREAMRLASVAWHDLKAVGIANQRETTLVWDRRTGRPLHNAIVWQDRRTAGYCDSLKRLGHEALIARKTGLVIDAYFSASKIRWILDHVPGARADAERGHLAFGTVDTWLLHRLTAGRVHATDVSNASRTLLLNLHTGDWDDELLALFDVPRVMMPEVRPSSGTFGVVAAEHLGGPVPVTAMAGDQQAALFGQTCVRRGLVKNTYGTGCFLLMNIGRTPSVSTHRLITTVAWKRGPDPIEYAMEGSTFVGGSVVQWLRDGLGLVKSSADIEPLAASVPDSGGVYLVPAFAGLGAPHWDQYARGTIAGLTRGTTAAHLARAALESIAFQVADLLAAIRVDSGIDIPELRVDGGAARNDLLMQFQADLLGVPVVRPQVTESTALGAAFLAGLAAGLWPDTATLEAQRRIDRTFDPAMPRADAARRTARWHKALDRARDWESPDPA